MAGNQKDNDDESVGECWKDFKKYQTNPNETFQWCFDDTT